MLGLEHALQSGKALFGDRLELGASEIDRAAIHRPQDPVRNIGRAGVHKKMDAVSHRIVPDFVPRLPKNRRGRRGNVRAPYKKNAKGDGGGSKKKHSARPATKP